MSDPQIDGAFAALARGDLPEAERLARGAATDDPASADAHRALGVCLQAAGRFHEAMEAFEQALALRPDDDGVAAALAAAAAQLGMRDAALALALHVASRRPGDVEATVALGQALLALDRTDDAWAVAHAAVTDQPDQPRLIQLAGRVSLMAGRLPDAVALLETALKLNPSDPRILYDLAWTLADAGELRRSLVTCDLALKSHPDAEVAARLRFLKATALLADGQLKEGWTAYAARLDPSLPTAPRFDLPMPRWDGRRDLTGRSLLLMAEQGLGDEIAFLGLVNDIRALLGPQGRLTVSADPRLEALIRRSWPGTDMIPHATREENGRRIRSLAAPVDAELWAPLGDFLPELRSDPARFVQTTGFLTPDPERVRHWRDWLSTLPAGRRVGVTWRSGRLVDGRSRGFAALGDWVPVLQTSGVVFVSLQYGDTGAEREALKTGLGVDVQQPPGLDAFYDLEGLAALSAALDLVIGFSNASANLAGAVGVPLWLITPPAPWTALGARDYPWYPQARRFTASLYGEWTSVMGRVAAALATQAG